MKLLKSFELKGSVGSNPTPVVYSKFYKRLLMENYGHIYKITNLKNDKIYLRNIQMKNGNYYKNSLFRLVV